MCLVMMFQFTHPVWGATYYAMGSLYHPGVSIHAPRVGCDGLMWAPLNFKQPFQFTHPVWGATRAFVN